VTVLTVSNLTKRFGGLTAVDDVSFSVEEGEIVGLIGPNGAGKSTTFNLVMGMLEPSEGAIEYRGERIDEMPTHKRVQAGLGRTYQTPKQFNEFTVWENIEACMLSDALSFGHQGDESTDEAVDQILERTGLSDRAEIYPDKLTPGELRRLEIAKALATDPDVLLCDEVFAGVTNEEASELAALLENLRDEGLTLLLVDHVMDILMPLVDRTIVLHFGQKIAEGTTDEVLSNDTVQEVYLGESSGVV
jgi:branched-chain amino acid transport system ATP-binding protein